MNARKSGFIQPSSWLQVVVITTIFAGLFFGLRSLPNAKCGFLHYEVTEVLADGTEVCAATNHAKFIDLDALSFPVEMDLNYEGPVRAGEKTEFFLRFLDRNGNPLLPHELAITHTERIHLMVVDRSLGDYHHIHPEPVGNNGDFRFFFEPAHGGSYRFFGEIVPVRTKRQVVASTFLEVDGAPPVPYFEEVGGVSLKSQWNEYQFELIPDKETFRKSRDNPFRLRVTREDGSEVDLQETMGAQAHLVAFDSGKSGFAHMHPASLEPVMGTEPTVPFYFYTPKRGLHRLWAQVRLEDQDVFVPFDLQVQ